MTALLFYLLNRFSRRIDPDVEIETAFDAVRYGVEGEPWSLRGASAISLFDQEKWFDLESGGVVLNRICKNEHGEYFCVVIAGGAANVTRLSPDRVKVLLRNAPELLASEFGILPSE
ncbi:MAG: hypothetical protein H6943_10755 [Zoogloeaceae bacterium]|nr:hypothetical protein [Zoogloeaceae bacterium]